MPKEVNIRVVRCPKCRVLLPELPEHPLYRCGNCETVIQAKNQKFSDVKSESNETTSSTDKDNIGSHGVISLSEGPSTSPEIICAKSENARSSNVADDESLSRKGKSKLINEEEEECDDKSNSLSESHVSLYITSPDEDQENLYHSPLNGPDSRTNGLSDYISASSPSSYHDLKPQSVSRYPGTSSYYAHGGTESSCDDRDFRRIIQKDAHNLVSHRTRSNLRKSETENLDLLRTVWELKDQLNRMHLPKNHPEDHDFPRHAFLGKSMQQYGAPMSCHCVHCYPHDLHRSAQLPCPCKHSTQYYCDTSSFMSPEHHYPRRNMSERRIEENSTQGVISKSHILPVCGGAPFVACYSCWEVLQIPAEFIITKKRYHKLMCGSCKKILRFSLDKDTHLAPCPLKDGVAPLMENVEAGVSASKRGNRRKGRSEKKAVPGSSTSPLHHLMGYSSPSQLMDI